MYYTIDSTTGCWIGKGALTGDGYSQSSIGGKTRYGHRIMWERVNGPIPEGMCVLHKCDVRSCVNPDHLFLGTRADNMRDAIAKDRRRCMHKLTDQDIQEIIDQPLIGRQVLAKKYQVSIYTIADIRAGRRTYKRKS
jgi:hypothetical protein